MPARRAGLGARISCPFGSTNDSSLPFIFILFIYFLYCSKVDFQVISVLAGRLWIRGDLLVSRGQRACLTSREGTCHRVVRLGPYSWYLMLKVPTVAIQNVFVFLFVFLNRPVVQFL